MVYCGPPSKGCSSCRDRKVRCDQREPGCGQCEKREQQCPGYRNMVDLMFRDESSHVIKKAKAKQRRKITASRTPEPGPSTDNDDDSSAVRTSVDDVQRGDASLPLTFILQPESLYHAETRQEQTQTQTQTQTQQQPEPRDDPPLPSPDGASWPALPMVVRMYNIDAACQERGTAFFFSRYVTMDENASHQRFDFLYDIWKPGALAAERPLDAVLASMTAVGLVGIAQLTQSEDIVDSARKSYGTALCLTNEALRDEREAVKDTTMLSILILGVFEMMAEPGMLTMTTWQDHINGAVILAKLRGVSQFQTRAGIRMFEMLCESVTISCLQQKVPMPEELAALQAVLFSHEHQHQHEPANCGHADLSTPMYMVLQAVHDIKTLRLMDNIDVLLERMDAIEAAFERGVLAFPPDWRYKKLKVTRPHKAVFRDACHVYASVATASVWNRLRVGRIMVLETVLSAVQSRFPDPSEHGDNVPPRYKTAYQQARRKLELVSAGVVASVPQHFGLLSPVNPYYDSLEPVPPTAVPISTIEVREPLTPPAPSPMSSAGSVQTPTAHSEDRSDDHREAPDVIFDGGGPSLDNPTRAQSADEEAERYMLLASATNAMVWPLFAVGVSSVCTPQLKAFVVARLMAIYEETGLKQARAVAAIVRSRALIKSPWMEALCRPSAPTDGEVR